jgi:hypothetical protein
MEGGATLRTTGWRIWGQAVARTTLGPGSVAPMLLTGGWMAGDLRAQRRALPAEELLRQPLRGFEDAAWYTRRLAGASMGWVAPVSPQLQVELFAIVARTSGDATRWAQPNTSTTHRAVGLAVQRKACLLGLRLPLTVRYQTTHRQQGANQPWLHLISLAY